MVWNSCYAAEVGDMHLNTRAFPPAEGLFNLGFSLRCASFWPNSQYLRWAWNVSPFLSLKKISSLIWLEQLSVWCLVVSLWRLFWKTLLFVYTSHSWPPFFLLLPPIMEAGNSNTKFPSLPWARCGHVPWLGAVIRRGSLLGVSGKFFLFNKRDKLRAHWCHLFLLFPFLNV